MTALIEPYSGYVLAWLLVGLAFNMAIMLGLITARWPRPFKPALSGYLLMWLISPALLLLMYLRWVGQGLYKAALAFKGFRPFNGSSNYLLLALFHGYMVFELMQLDKPLGSKVVGLLIFGGTAVLLCHAAKAIQDKAKAEQALEEEPEPEEETLESLLEYILNTPEARANRLAYQHQENLSNIKKQADRIKEMNELRYVHARNKIEKERHAYHRAPVSRTLS